MRVSCLILLGLVTLPALAGGGFPERHYLCIVDGIDGFADDFAPPDASDDRMACRGAIHDTLRTPTDDHISITSAGARDTTARSDGITVRFRAAGASTEVGL